MADTNSPLPRDMVTGKPFGSVIIPFLILPTPCGRRTFMVRGGLATSLLTSRCVVIGQECSHTRARHGFAEIIERADSSVSSKC
jgi:hypothetical protein